MTSDAGAGADSWSVRAAAGRRLAADAEVPEVAVVLGRLLLDPYDTFVTRETAEALYPRPALERIAGGHELLQPAPEHVSGSAGLGHRTPQEAAVRDAGAAGYVRVGLVPFCRPACSGMYGVDAHRR
ncbi:hypothetical protein [Streptomyces sp. AC154]|uniref:hypothetical protein n=1 Tax=Streptomyces sp. AC154 TaxID=3143184 RepID=UPI003F8064D9